MNQAKETEIICMKKIIHYVHIAAPISEVYQALTTQKGLSGWWTTDVKVEPGVGGIVDFYFNKHFHPDMKVTNLNEDTLVEWECVSGHDNWQDNIFSFELRSEGNTTKLMFNQIYAQELSDEIYGTYNYNWGYYLNSLKKFCETGTGVPYSPQSKTY